MRLPDSVEYKFYRSVLHLKEFTVELEKYVQTNPCGMMREPNSPADNPTFVFRVRNPIPARFGLIVGDFLQNLRSTLDYLVWEMVLIEGKPDKYNMFPICETPEGFKNAIKGKRLRGVPAEAIEIIDALQPYHLAESEREKSTLLVLDRLANINKHRHVLLTNMQSYMTSDLPTVNIDGELWAYAEALTPDDNSPFNFPVRPNEVMVNAQIIVFMTLDERAIEKTEVASFGNALAKHVRKDVLALFERFF
jgi:hypothetical protein